MIVPAKVPTAITPEAAERLAELGMHAELDSMLDRAREFIPGLRRLDVVLEPMYDTRDETGITIEITRDHPVTFSDPAKNAWRAWLAATFPREVGQHFGIRDSYEEPDAR